MVNWDKYSLCSVFGLKTQIENIVPILNFPISKNRNFGSG